MTIEEGIAKWKPKAEEAARIGRGVTVSPAWLLELMECARWRAKAMMRSLTIGEQRHADAEFLRYIAQYQPSNKREAAVRAIADRIVAGYPNPDLSMDWPEQKREGADAD